VDLLTRIRTDIDKRLDELRPQIEEIPRLEAALKALDQADGRSPARTKPAAARRRATGRRPSTRKRAPRGQNREAILRVISERHGVSAGEVANATKIAKPTVYTTISKLLKEGTVKRTEDGRPGGRLSTGGASWALGDAVSDAQAPTPRVMRNGPSLRRSPRAF
jgi:DNA-binding transcriptional ArsR family regulator